MAGLLDFLNPQSQGLGAQPQQGLGFMGRAASFRDQNPGALTALGAGIMAGNPAAGFLAASKPIAEGRRQNSTAQYLLTKGIAKTPEEAMTLAGQPELLNLALKAPDEYTQRAEAAQRYGLKPSDPNYQAFVLGTDATGGGQETWSVVPTYGKNAQGEDVLGVTSNRGNFKQIDTGSDFKPMGSGDKAYDRSYQGGLGKNRAEADASYRSIKSKMPALEANITTLKELSDQATYTPLGRAWDATANAVGAEPREAAIARTKYEAMVSNAVLPMLRDTFGAAFTEREGETLRATMGDANLSPKQKQAVLDAFIQQKRQNIEAEADQAGLGGGGSAVPPPSGGTDYKSKYGLD